MNQMKRIKGFTLVEMLAVVIIIGLLITYLVPKVVSVLNTSKAKVMLGTATDIQNALTSLASNCSTSGAVASNSLPASGKTLSDVIFGGASNVATNFQSCYTQSHVIALTDASQPGATTGVYNVQGFPVTLAGGSPAPLQVSYGCVPDDITLLMAQTYNQSLAALLASDTTSGVVQYSAIANNCRTVTVLRQ
jgi:prepilin-type N-terminal cleavage/methylation domain-containing protein